MDTETQPKPSLNEGIAEEIRALLARRRLSASDLARMTGLTQRAISRRLTGEKVIDADDLQRFAEALEVDYRDLLPQRDGMVVAVGGTPRPSRPKVNGWYPAAKRPNRPPSRTSPDPLIRRPGRPRVALVGA
jgi:DNA-binding Xre family transcriptional regulator